MAGGEPLAGGRRGPWSVLRTRLQEVQHPNAQQRRPSLNRGSVHTASAQHGLPFLGQRLRGHSGKALSGALL